MVIAVGALTVGVTERVTEAEVTVGHVNPDGPVITTL